MGGERKTLFALTAAVVINQGFLQYVLSLKICS